MSGGAYAPRLVIMAKAPLQGLVKTRLARDIGAVAATAAYRLLLADTLRAADDPRWRTCLAVAPDIAARWAVWPSWPAASGPLAMIGQGGGDLGRRMQHVFDTLPPGPVIIVGSDIAGLGRADIAAGFRALGRAQAVFGPARDGGYWLVGQKRMPKPLPVFADVRWSSEHTLKDSLANLDGHEVALLRQLEDVDDAASYRRWRWRRRT